ncbi:MAG: signal peptide peptidase SppA [Chitinophagales bacterium]|nr:signal peptide peptidase SppA [Chitinophagales bacterium]MDW8418777.1 signal peptide peptidase SppA [Chitinophagales bacterium]
MLQFLKYVLATLVGLLLFCSLCFIFLLTLIGMASMKKPVTVEANSVLKLDLNYDIPERSTDDPLSTISYTDFKPKKAIGLTDILACITKAKTDDNIKGIYLQLGLNDNGYATLEAIREALLDFRKSKKFVFAYGEIISQKSYYLATAADKIFLNPSGMLELKGFGREILYYKNMFDRLGIEVQDFHCGSYKSAIEPFVRNNMSEYNRQQLTNIYTDLYRHFVNQISIARSIDTATLQSIINTLAAESPEKCKELSLVNEIYFYDQVVKEMKRKVGVDEEKDLKMIDLAKYAATLEDNRDADNKIAVIYAEGQIVNGEGEDREIGGERYAKIISKLRKDEKVKAIVLRVNSPGGSALASDVIWRELSLAKEKKPLIVSMGDYAASGGYYIAAPANRIFALPNTITGSIGVFGLLPNARKMLNDKLGITVDEVEVTNHGVLGGITKPLDNEERAVMQRSVERTYREFKERVAEGRKKDTAYIESIAQGRVWTGNQALQNGLVDEIGGLNDAIAYAAKMANIKEYRIKNYPEEKSFAEKISESLGAMREKHTKEQLGELYEVYRTLRYLRNASGIQMRMLYDIK